MDTIAAIATGTGVSAIGIIRLSGDRAIACVSKVFRAYSGKPVPEFEDRKLYYGQLLYADGGVLDVCLCTVSRGPNSYTGEDTAELQCHGSPLVLVQGLHELFAGGARQAQRGEFTKRAFLNGRMDLVQAEAVVDLIDAETQAAARNAAGQLEGAVGRITDGIYDSLVDMASHFHAVIDYPDEDIEDFRLREYEGVLEKAQASLERLLNTYSLGRVMTAGVATAIIGCPNVGKSSLLNALLGYERAIVTDVPGTTRDTVEEKLKLGGTLLRLIDTAGIRKTDDTVESIGVERAFSAAAAAQLVISVVDGSRPLTDADMQVLKTARMCKSSIVVLNKSDLGSAVAAADVAPYADEVCVMSAKTGEGKDGLEEAVEKLFAGREPDVWGEILTNERHAEAAGRALEAIKSARAALIAGVTPDAVLTDTEYAMAALGEMSGKTVREDVTSRIFDRFCVGK